MSLTVTGTNETTTRGSNQRFKGHTNLVRGVIHLLGKQHILTCSEDGSLRLWDLNNGSQIGKDWKEGKSAVFTIALSPDGKRVASGSGDGAVRLWDIDNGRVIAKWTGHSDIVWSVCWSRDGQRVVSGSEDGTARVWDTETGEAILGPVNTKHRVVYAVVYSPDGTLIASGGYDWSIRIWDARTVQLVTTLKGHTWDVYCLAWIGNGKALISGSIDHSIRIWNTTTWKQSAVLTEHSNAIRGLAISTNGRMLASASLDNTVRLWNLENGQSISSPLQHRHEVFCISFSVDGKLLATGCDDDDAYTWDVSAIVKEAGFDGLLADCDVPIPVSRPPEAAKLTDLSYSQHPARKLVLDANATRRPLNNTHALPQGFFDDTRDRIYSSSSARPAPCSSARQSRPRALLDRYYSLFRRSSSPVRNATSHVKSTLFRPLHWALDHFGRRHSSDNKQRLPEVEVPCTRGQARNIKVTGKSKVPSPNNIITLHVPGSSRPPNSDVAQQPSEGVRTHQSQLRLRDLLVTTHEKSITTTMSVAEEPLHPDIVIRQVGCWTRFLLLLCCISSAELH